jgi:hypothetical protein
VVIDASLHQLDIEEQASCFQDGNMSKNWMPPLARIAHGCADWLRTPQPRSGAGFGAFDDADGRRTRTELDAIRARFPDHA